jgi:hypothetical protein
VNKFKHLLDLVVLYVFQACGGILHHRREVCSEHREPQAAEVLSKLSTMNDKSSFVIFPLVITKQ